PLTNRLAEVWDASRTEEEHQHNRNDDQLRRTEAENRERKEFLHAAEHLAPGRVGASRTHTGARPCLSLRRTLERPECRVNQGTHTSDGRHTPSADITTVECLEGHTCGFLLGLLLRPSHAGSQRVLAE